MQSISIKDYHNSMGPLIDVEDANTYKTKHINGAINIPYLELSYNFKNLIDKNKNYYIYCKDENKRRRIVYIMKIYENKVKKIKI